MKFRTEVNFNDSNYRLNIEDSVFSIGSCFANEMHEKLDVGQIQSFNNPFGTIFNPYSVNLAIQKIYQAAVYEESDLILANDLCMSLDHHTSFDSRFVHTTLDKINTNIQQANDFLQKSNCIIITYGSAYIYEFLPKNKLVANCHKIAPKFFKKRFLTDQELRENIAETLETIKDIATENVQIFFTVSPVRHTKDGMVENQLSKAKIITAIHDVLPNYSHCHYLPVYEIMMDDLRDYRFYKEDMIHPNAQAVQYIWEKFGNSFFTDETKIFINENNKIKQALSHKSTDEESPKHKEFLDKLKFKIIEQQQKVKHKIFAEFN